VITNDTERLRTEAHLAQFERALTNLTVTAGDRPTKLQQLEIDAIRAMMSDFRMELREHGH
jgi:hypothetical protein